VQRGDVIGRILARSEDSADTGMRAVLAALGWSSVAVDPPALIHDVVASQGPDLRPEPVLKLENA
jgi:hypothetical protein